MGDKAASKEFAVSQGVPVAKGSGILTGVDQAIKFMTDSKVDLPVLIKAVHGGGGRGQRVTLHVLAVAQLCCCCAE